MPEIEIRPAEPDELNAVLALNPHFASEYVWQMELDPQGGQSGGRFTPLIAVRFRQVRLPREVRVEYPRSTSLLSEELPRRSGLLVGELAGRLVGYAALSLGRAPGAVWVTDLVVDRPFRRQGIGTGLLLAVSEWAATMDESTVILEMQPKNYPAIQLADKLGFDFCGYNDIYYGNHGIGIFFRKSI